MQSKMIPLTPSINYALRYSKHYSGIDSISLVRSLCDNDDFDQLLIEETRRAYINSVGSSNLSNDFIDQQLNALMFQNSLKYVYPFPKSKMHEVLFAGLCASLAQKMFDTLSNHPLHQLMSFKSYTIYNPVDLAPEQYEQLITPLTLKSLDLNQLVQNLYTEMTEYQHRIAELETANEMLSTTISQLTQQVSQHTLTRWY
jgi:hypothetical protein